MDVKELFDKYYSRLAKEGFLKALFSGLVIAFAFNFLVAFIFWFLDAKGLWWSLGAFVVALAVSTPLLYVKKYRPTSKQVAERIDKLGLEERMITMNQFIADDSFIAQKQREDAKIKLGSLSAGLITFVFSRVLLVGLVVSAVMGAGMTTVSSLSDEGILLSGKDVVELIIPDEPVEYVTVSYVADEGGLIEGDEVQILEKGGNATEVIAVAEDGWTFVEWSDGVTDPYRSDYRIGEDKEFVAIFGQLGDGDGDGEGEGEGQPSDGEGQPGAGDEPSKSDQPSDPDAPPNNGANGSYTENNMVLDGDTYYRDVFEEYYNQAMEYLAKGEDIPDELRALIQTYFDVIL